MQSILFNLPVFERAATAGRSISPCGEQPGGNRAAAPATASAGCGSCREGGGLSQRVQTVPDGIQRSRLMRAGGFAVFSGVTATPAGSRLFADAQECARHAKESFIATSDAEEYRGGRPARRFLSVSAGTAQSEFSRNAQIIAWLSSLCGAPVRPTGERGTYTFYSRPGDFLGLHRDIETCDVAVITCLYDEHRAGSRGGVSRLYPQRRDEPLSWIRAKPREGAVELRIEPGQTLVMFGGIIPHEILPMGPGDRRIVSILCYRADSA